MTGPFQGVSVLELASGIAGPYCGMVSAPEAMANETIPYEARGWTGTASIEPRREQRLEEFHE
jgi:crotonobetainyl-CoA:carnitine CoA-transferase CaiB-like acyl-CoA transferase